MHVYLDAQPLLGARSGVSNYVRNLYNHLINFEELDISLFFNRIAKNIPKDDLDIVNSKNSRMVNTRYPYKVIRRFLKTNFLHEVPFDYFRHSSESLFHGTNFTHIPTKSNKSIITIHDLAYMIYPETTSEKILKHHSRWVPYSAQRASKIIAVSEHTKKDIVRLLKIPHEKIEVIHLAADQRYRPVPPSEVQDVLSKYRLPKSYILFVGTIEPRKNLLGFLKAYYSLVHEYNCQEKLVVVGAKGWKYSPVFDFIKENGLESHVIFTGFVEDGDLVSIYNGASLFIMPSIYEGFGIPILEAMGCGIPVIGSNVSSIPEIIDRHGILLPPTDDQVWARTIYELLNDPIRMKTYQQLSLERASQFTWTKTALETKNLYDKILTM